MRKKKNWRRAIYKSIMAVCAGCTNKFKLFEKPQVCPECHRNFCSMCIPKGKKLQQSTRETCVYCDRKQREANRNEEAKILENFQERFYKHAHHGPTIQTKVQLDHKLMHSDKNISAAVSKLSEEDRKLEERLRQLKASRKPVGPSYSEDEIKHKLAKLRESDSTTSSSQPSTTETTQAPQVPGRGEKGDGEARHGVDKTQIEQARDLLEQASDEVKLDERLAESKGKKDESLYTRLQVLKGKEGDATKPFHSAKSDKSESDMHKFLDNMEVKVTDGDDPEKLLEDLREFQAKEEKSALAEAQSDEMQALVGRFQKSEEREEETSDSHEAHQPVHSKVPYITPYPILSDLKSDAFDSGPTTDKVSKEDIAKLMKGAAEEIRHEKQQEIETRAFIQDASERLANLRDKSSEKTGRKEEDSEIVSNPEQGDSEPVSSKVTSDEAQNLDFSWSHFGSSIPRNPSSELLAAQQLGITDFLGEGDEEEEESLINRMVAEAALDSRLEESGYNLDAAPQASALSKRDQEDHRRDLGGASVGASAASNYWSNDSEDELPWCCICNRDATLRCFDCDDDLYCTRCFSEGHEQFGLFDHRYAPYQPHARAK